MGAKNKSDSITISEEIEVSGKTKENWQEDPVASYLVIRGVFDVRKTLRELRKQEGLRIDSHRTVLLGGRIKLVLKIIYADYSRFTDSDVRRCVMGGNGRKVIYRQHSRK